MESNILEELGLSNAESKLYLTLLEVGPSKTGILIDKSKLQSSTVYRALGSLAEKGLVSYILKGKQKYFQAEKPESFLTYLEDKKKKFQEFLPILKQKQAVAKQRLKAEIYEGIKGLRAAFDDILKTLKQGDLYYFFSSPQKDIDAEKWITYFRNYHLKRAEKRIKVRGLSTPEGKDITKKVFKNIKLAQIKYITDFAPTGLVVYSNKLITWEWTDTPTAVVIESESIARSYKEFFERMWEKAMS